jgi:hypothetical protein
MTDEPYTRAARDVIAERLRQINEEGWSAEHDEKYTNEQLAYAAGCYCAPIWPDEEAKEKGDPPIGWPWPWRWWKPGEYRRNLVKAGALILAEIERLDRAATRESA